MQLQLHEGETENGQPQLPEPSRDASLPRPWFDAMAAVARRKLNAPPEWEWYSASVIRGTENTLLIGGIPNFRKDGAPRAGREKWAGVKGKRVVVTDRDIAAACADYERTTGNCHSCAGCGETLASSHFTRGHTYRVCRRCEGSGRATGSLAGAPVPAVDRSRSSTNPAPAVAEGGEK